MPSNQPPQTIGDAARSSLIDALEGYVKGGLQDFAFAASDLPNFLADTSPIVAAAQPTRQIVRAACRTYARGGGPQNLPGFDAIWGGICEPYLDSIGENPGEGSIAPPYTGGQCPATYLVYATSQGQDLNIGGQTPRNLVGPLGSVTKTETVIGSPFPDSTRYRFTFSGPNDGVEFTSRSTFNPDPGIRIDGRTDGGSDNCGDPPSDYTPAPIPPGLPPLTPEPINFPGIGPVDVGVTFSPTGDLVVSLPDLGIDVTVPDPTGDGSDGDGGGGDGGGGSAPPGDVGTPGAPESTGDGGEAEGEAPEGQVLVGLKVEILTFPPSRNKYTSDVFRGAYYAYMGVPGLLDLDPAGATVRLNQFIFAEKDNLTAWRVSANRGYTTQVTPYYREPI